MALVDGLYGIHLTVAVRVPLAIVLQEFSLLLAHSGLLGPSNKPNELTMREVRH